MGVALDKKVDELQASCRLLVSQVASIKSLAATPTNTEAEVGGAITSMTYRSKRSSSSSSSYVNRKCFNSHYVFN